jgi:putative membrane protein
MNRTTKLLCTAALGCAALTLTTSARAEVTDQDKQFLTTASQANLNEIKLSELAEQKASSPEVKAYAHKMVADHNTLGMKMKPFADAWAIPAPSSLDADHQAEYDKLNGLSGSDFDKEYIAAMDKDHHLALDLFTAEASSTTDAKFKAAVLQGKSVVSAHTHMADSMAAKMS